VILAGGKLLLKGHTLTGNSIDPVVECSRNCQVEGPGTVTGGGAGIYAGTSHLLVKQATITGNNGVGVDGNRKVMVQDSVVSFNGSPLVPGPFVFSGGVHSTQYLSLKGANIHDNLNFGVEGATVVVRRASSVIHNGENPDCVANPRAVSFGCADLAVTVWQRPPHVSSDSTCGTSQHLYEDIGTSWHVCTNDPPP
jgi:hypothetical protein